MNLPPLSEAQIREHASAESFSRGMTYYRRGAVGALILRGDLFQTEVEGREYALYQVTVRFDPNGVPHAACTCPYDWGGWCKHIVAALLTYINAVPADFDVRPPLTELLAGLDRDQLVALLMRLVDADAALIDQIEALLVQSSVATTQVPLAGTPAQRPPMADLTALRQQIRRVFRNERPDDYIAYASILENLQPFVIPIRANLVADQSHQALTLLEALTDEYAEHWSSYDDSDGELSNFFAELGELWAEALLGAELQASERQHWFTQLEAWAASAQAYGCEGLELALDAAADRWDGPQDDDQPWSDRALHGHFSAELLTIRLRVLERKGRFEEALHLAAATGRLNDQAQLLLRIGRSTEALELALQQFTTTEQALEFAEVLHERGDLEAALAVAEHGLGLDPDGLNPDTQQHNRARLAAWLADLAAAQGRLDLAVRAGREALYGMPELKRYRHIAELVTTHPTLIEGGWPVLRAQLLTAFHTSTGWYANGRIEIFLHEGLVDDAIAALGAHPSSETLARVMDAALATHPDWVITTATARAAAIIEAGKAQEYAAAVGWLRRARDAYQAVGRSPEWQAYLQNLRSKHGRKRKLMGLLDELARARR